MSGAPEADRGPGATARLARIYFALQAGAVALWWVALVGWPELQATFGIRGAPPVVLLAFAPADTMLLVGGSLAAAAARGRWAAPIAFVVAGAAVYATLYTLAAAAAGATSWIGFALMAPSAVLSTWAAVSLANAHRHGLPSRGTGIDRA